MDTPHSLPRRPDSYEKQLSDSELRSLHSWLLERKLTLEQIQAKLPPWRAGSRTGQKVGLQTLCNIRERLELEDNLAEDGETTQTLLEQLRSQVPEISDEQIAEIGNRTFSLLSIRRQDAKTFIRLQSAKTKAELEQAKLALAERAEARQSEALALEKEKFQRQAAKAALSDAILELAARLNASSLSNEEKITAMRDAMFADVDALEKSGEVVIPR